jgi:hypothetical protein
MRKSRDYDQYKTANISGKFSEAREECAHVTWGSDNPKSVAEAKESDLRIAEDALLSRLRPIQDGPDQSQDLRSRADPGSRIGSRVDSDNVPI